MKFDIFFFGRLGVPLGRTNGEKCFLNPIGFRKFFECFPNQYAEHFVGGGENSATVIYRKFDTFFSPPEICGKMSQKSFAMKSAVEFFSMKSAVEIFFDFFSMKSAVQMFFEFFSMKSAVEIFVRIFFNETSSGNCFRRMVLQ